MNWALREKCSYSEFSGSYFPAFGLNTRDKDQKNSEYGHFPRSGDRLRFWFC